MTKVMLVDDHPIVLSGLSALVESDDGLELVGTARTAAEARAATAEPDVAVIDLELPDGDGIELGSRMKQAWPNVRVLVLTMHADDAAVIRSIAAGLNGYLLKDCDPEDVLAAIHTAAGGGLVLGRGASGATASRRCCAISAWTSWARSTPGTGRSSICSSAACRPRRSLRDSSSPPRRSATGSRRC